MKTNRIFAGLKRQGPGGDGYTRLALSLIPALPKECKVLDIGCGTGAQTLVLASKVPHGSNVALDVNPEHLIDLRNRAAEKEVDSSIKIVKGSMFDLPFHEERFDLILSEGSIYIIGFRKGLEQWSRLLKPGGHLVASHLSWTRSHAPKDVLDFWNKETEVSTISQNIEMIELTNLTLRAIFVLPADGWWENFYLPLSKRIDRVRRSDPSDFEKGLIAQIDREIEIFKEFQSYYGYVFYILRKEG